MFRIGFAADRADFESAGDIGDSAGAIDALAIESVGVVFASFLGRAVDVAIEFFFDPVAPPSGVRWEFSVVFDVDDVIGVLIPDVARRNPSVESVFEDHDVGLAHRRNFSRRTANFVVARFPALGAFADADGHRSPISGGIIFESDFWIDGVGADILFEKDAFARTVFDVLRIAFGIGCTRAQAERLVAVFRHRAIFVVDAADAFVNGIDAVVDPFSRIGHARVASRIGRHENLGAAVVVDVGDDRGFDRCARGAL